MIVIFGLREIDLSADDQEYFSDHKCRFHLISSNIIVYTNVKWDSTLSCIFTSFDFLIYKVYAVYVYEQSMLIC